MTHLITDEEIAGIGQELAAANNVSDIDFARSIESKIIAKLREQSPSAWWIKEAEQFHIGKRPFAKAWTPLYSNPMPPDDVVRDAERYQFLKENIREGYEFLDGYYLSDNPKGWDKTIDAAMKGLK